jgi:hypothetical protein
MPTRPPPLCIPLLHALSYLSYMLSTISTYLTTPLLTPLIPLSRMLPYLAAPSLVTLLFTMPYPAT